MVAAISIVKMSFESSEMEWMEEENLGDRMLFLSHGTAIQLGASWAPCPIDGLKKEREKKKKRKLT